MPRPNTYAVYLITRAVSSFAFALIITYELVYHTVEIGLTPLQLITVGVVLESMTFLFEIPTGVVADTYSRRLSVLIGVTLIGVGFLIEGCFATMTAVLLAQVLWGIGFTFFSGAEAAWITDEIGQERASQAFLQAAQLGQVMSLVGIGTGALLVNFGINVPIITGALIYLVLVLFLIWTMPETGFHPLTADEQQGLAKRMIAPAQEGIQLLQARPILARILLIGVVIGLYVGGFDRLYAAHLTENFVLPALGGLTPIAWFSVMSGLIGIGSLAGTELVRRRLDVTKNLVVVRSLFGLYSGMIVCTLIFALTRWFWIALVCFCVSQTLRNVGRPMLTIWINQHAETRTRATVISMYWQSNALGQIAGSPVIGWIGTAFSLRAALTTGTSVYTLVLPLLKREGDQFSGD